ncbi:hypothetical protein ACFTRD_21470 [Paenibacillus sp. NPDC056933]
MLGELVVHMLGKMGFGTVEWVYRSEWIVVAHHNQIALLNEEGKGNT